VVCASGNPGLVYLTRLPGRATLEAITAAYPGLVDGLVRHPGVGFVLVRSAEHGPIAIGRDGGRHLSAGTVSGRDPLAAFGPRAVEHLLRLDGFPHVADLVVNSVVDDAGEVAPFEEQVGSHGGLGGPQTDAFLFIPTGWSVAQPVVSAVAVNAPLREHLPGAPRAAAAAPAPAREGRPVGGGRAAGPR
jgi:hypothetical protein